ERLSEVRQLVAELLDRISEAFAGLHPQRALELRVHEAEHAVLPRPLVLVGEVRLDVQEPLDRRMRLPVRIPEDSRSERIRRWVRAMVSIGFTRPPSTTGIRPYSWI